MPENRKSHAPSSSSSIVQSDRIESNRIERQNEEEEDKLTRTLAQFGYTVPAYARRHRTKDALVRALAAPPFSMAVPDAVSLIGQYGFEAVEGAMAKTLAQHDIRKPVGWLVSTLKRGWGWSQEELEYCARHEREQLIERARKSEEPTLKRLIAEYERPENIVRFAK